MVTVVNSLPGNLPVSLARSGTMTTPLIVYFLRALSELPYPISLTFYLSKMSAWYLLLHPA